MREAELFDSLSISFALYKRDRAGPSFGVGQKVKTK
jgi:hypothetical protein